MIRQRLRHPPMQWPMPASIFSRKPTAPTMAPARCASFGVTKPDRRRPAQPRPANQCAADRARPALRPSRAALSQSVASPADNPDHPARGRPPLRLQHHRPGVGPSHPAAGVHAPDRDLSGARIDRAIDAQHRPAVRRPRPHHHPARGAQGAGAARARPRARRHPTKARRRGRSRRPQGRDVVMRMAGSRIEANSLPSTSCGRGWIAWRESENAPSPLPAPSEDKDLLLGEAEREATLGDDA